MQLDVRLIVPGPTAGSILLAPDGALPATTIEAEDEIEAMGPLDLVLRETWRLPVPVLELHPKWKNLPSGSPIPTLVMTEPAPIDWAPAAELRFGPISGRMGELPASLRDRADELL